MITSETRGLIYGLDNEEYHDDRHFISSSCGKLILEKSPADYKYKYIDKNPSKSTASKSTGSASHSHLLENFKFWNEYYVGLSKHTFIPGALYKAEDMKELLGASGLKKSGKKEDLLKRIKDNFSGSSRAGSLLESWNELSSRHDRANYGKLCISPDQMEIIDGINDSIGRNSRAMEILGASKKEVSIFGQGSIYPELLKKGRFDILPDDGFHDFKTAKIASLEYFQKSVTNFNYDLQFAWYADLYREHFGRWPKEICAIVAETEPPYNVSVFDVDEDIMYYGQCKYEDAMERIANCMKWNFWPDYQGSDKSIKLNYNGWQYRQLEERYGSME